MLKKSVVFTQSFILVLCVLHQVYLRQSILETLALLAVLEVGAFTGSWWARRLRKKVSGDTPLRPLF